MTVVDEIPAWGQVLQSEVRTVQAAIKQQREDIDDLYSKWDALKDFMNTRLPIWVTLAFTVLGSTITGLTVALVSGR